MCSESPLKSTVFFLIGGFLSDSLFSLSVLMARNGVNVI
jgi:hypothetical protein